ncbi:active regulator of SIRT1-like [Glandiceps talaboti]
MSASLVRKGLDLFSDDVKTDSEKSSKKKKSKHGPPDNMRLISTNRKGVKKQLKRLQMNEGFKKHKTTVKDKKTKSAIDSYWKCVPADNTEDNLRYMLHHPSSSMDSHTFTQILSHHDSQKNRSKAEPEMKKEDTTIFDEEDFNIFDKEYTVSVKR